MARNSSIIKAIITADTQGFKNAVKGLDQDMSKWGKNLTRNMTLPLAAAGVGMFKLASDLQESTSQVQQVFGDAADDMIRDAQNLEDSFSETEFLAFAGNIGDIAQGMGFAKDESAELSRSVLSLGQDLGSFKNLPTEQAVNAITSAMTGEREALKSLGIVVNEEMVKQKAMTMGINDGTTALTQQEKAQATLALITEASGNAIGDFDRTSGDAAGQTRILTANFKDAAAELGENLIPIGTQLLGWGMDIIGVFNDMSPTMQKVVLGLGGIAAAAGPVMRSLGAMGTAMKGLSSLSGIAAGKLGLIGVAAGGTMLGIKALWDMQERYLTDTSFSDAAERNAAAIDGLADTVDGLTGQMTDATREMYAAEIQATGFGDAFTEAGLSGDRLWEAIENVGDTSNDAAMDLADLMASELELRGATDENWKALVNLIGGWGEAQRAAAQTSELVGDDGLAGDTDDAAIAAENLDNKWSDLVDQLLGSLDTTAATNSLLEDVQDTLGELNEMSLAEIQTAAFDLSEDLAEIWENASPADRQALEDEFGAITFGIAGIGGAADLSKSQLIELRDFLQSFQLPNLPDYSTYGGGARPGPGNYTVTPVGAPATYGGMTAAEWQNLSVTVNVDGRELATSGAQAILDSGGAFG